MNKEKVENALMNIAVTLMFVVAVFMIGFSSNFGPTGAMVVTVGNQQELNLPLIFGIGLLILGLILFVKKK